ASFAGRGILERWHPRKRFLGSAWQDKLSISQLELVDRDGDVTPVETQKAAGTHNAVGHRLVRGDDDVLDGANAFLLVVVDRFSEDLPLDTPTFHHVAQLGDGYAEGRRAYHLSSRRHRPEYQTALA